MFVGALSRSLGEKILSEALRLLQPGLSIREYQSSIRSCGSSDMQVKQPIHAGQTFQYNGLK